jgi:hypothetical protein
MGVSSGNMGGFLWKNVWLRVGDCMDNVDWRLFLACGG